MEDQKKIIEDYACQIIESFQESKEAWLGEYYAYLEPLLLKAREHGKNIKIIPN